MTPETLSALHGRCFTDTPRPWTAAEFAAFIAEPSTIFAARDGGFAVGRVVGPEAELLTLAVAPEARRRGLGRTLVRAFEAEAGRRGAVLALLEVAVTNDAGRGLYATLGYAQVGRRRGYYARAGAPPVDALVLSRALALAGEPAENR